MTDVSLALGVGLICALLSALGTNLPSCSNTRRAVAASDVDMRRPLGSAIDLFRSTSWIIGCGVAGVAFALHVAALTLPDLDRPGASREASSRSRCSPSASSGSSWALASGSASGLVGISLTSLMLTGGVGGGAHSRYSLAGMIIFEGIAVGVGLLLLLSHPIERIPAPVRAGDTLNDMGAEPGSAATILA